MRGSTRVRSVADIARAVGADPADVERVAWADPSLAKLILPGLDGKVGFTADGAAKVIAEYVRTRTPAQNKA